MGRTQLTTDDNGHWIWQPTLHDAAMHAIPFPDFSEGYASITVYELNQNHMARIVDKEANA